MSIKFLKQEGRFLLTTKDTLYAITLLHGRYLVHSYYGKKRPAPDLSFEPCVVSFSPYKAEYGNQYSPDVFFNECSGYGSGDFRPTAIRIKNGCGNSVTEFAYVGYKKYKGRHEIPGLPHARAGESTETLEIRMKDATAGRPVASLISLTSCQLLSASRKFM